jgi:hypothetical protein
MLSAGASWIDTKTEMPPAPRFSLLGKASESFEKMLLAAEGRLQSPDEYPLVLMPFGWRGAVGNAQVAPVMSKLYQESGLRDLANQAFINPDTGKVSALIDGEPALIKTSHGSHQVKCNSIRR